MYQRVKDLRDDRDLSQQKLADYLHCSQRAYSHYELGDVDIPTGILSKLADFHSTSVDYLLGRTDIKEPYPPRRAK